MTEQSITRTEVSRHLALWAREADRLTYEPKSMVLGVRRDDEAMIYIDVRCPDVDRVVMEHRFTVTSSHVDAGPGATRAEREEMIVTEFQRIARQRSGLLACDIRAYSGMIEAVISYTVYSDGLSHHNFMMGVREIERTATLMTAFLDDLTAQAESVKQMMAQLAREPSSGAAT